MHRFTRLTRPHRLAVLVILLVHAGLSAFYSFNTPLWESYDETGHYAYARYIAVNNKLPPLGTTLVDWDETHQPPLYYWLAALPMRWAGSFDEAQPRYAVSSPVHVVPDDRIDAFPYQGTALAMRLGRMISVLLSTLAVGLTYLTSRVLWPRNMRLALLGALVHGLWPLLLFLGGVLTNDIGIAVFGSLTLYVAARLLVRHRHTQRWGIYAALAASLAGAILSKDSGIALILFALVIVAALTWHDLRKRAFAQLIGLPFFAALLVLLVAFSGWISDGRALRQFTTASAFTTSMADIQPATDQAQPPASTLDAPQMPSNPAFSNTAGWRGLILFGQEFFDWLWRRTFDSLFALFGWGRHYLPSRWYDFALVSACAAGVGLVLALRRSGDRRPILLLAILCGCVSLVPVLRSIASANPSLLLGRFLLPLLGALALLLAKGWLCLPKRFHLKTVVLTFSVAGMAMVALMSPWLVIAPIYRKPTLLDPAARPAAMQHDLNMTFGDSIQLLGYSVPNKIWSGENGGIILYWRALKPMQKDFGLRVETFSVNGQSFQNGIDTTPGSSVFPTSFWKPGDTFAETYFLNMTPPTDRPTLAQVKVTWFGEGRTADPLLAALEPACPDQQPCDPKFGSIAVGVERNAEAEKSRYHFGNQISLIDAHAPEEIHAGSTLTVSLVLRADASNMPARTAFIHLLSQDGTRVAQVDKPPLEGIYPSTVWSAGEVVRDEFVLTLPADLLPGTYTLAVGIYDSATVERLMATDADGARQHNDMAQLQQVTVVP